ncbi:MAG: hypothetical protein ABIT38_06955, partial [Gemmatimonadaceae bacterium]
MISRPPAVTTLVLVLLRAEYRFASGPHTRRKLRSLGTSPDTPATNARRALAEGVLTCPGNPTIRRSAPHSRQSPTRPVR